MIEDDLWQRARVLRVYPSTPLELDTAKLISDAADEVLTLRLQIDEAPHADGCSSSFGIFGKPAMRRLTCDCWKSTLESVS